MIFLRPWWFLALLPALFCYRRLKGQLTNLSPWQKICDPHLLEALTLSGEATTRFPTKPYILLLWCLTIFTLSGPSWSHKTTPLFQQLPARVFILDMSPSMGAQDLLPSRLARARFKVLEFLKAIKEGETALVVFSGEAYTAAPLTRDSDTISNLVPTLKKDIMPVAGFNLKAALQQAGTLLQQAGYQQGSIIVLTDKASNDSIRMAKKLGQQGFKTFVMGVGTTRGAPIPMPGGGFLKHPDGTLRLNPLNQKALIELAKAGDGHYTTIANNNDDISSVLAETNRQKIKSQQKNLVVPKDNGNIFIWLLLCLASLFFRQGWFECL